jgi:hypothetical protein
VLEDLPVGLDVYDLSLWDCRGEELEDAVGFDFDDDDDDVDFFEFDFDLDFDENNCFELSVVRLPCPPLTLFFPFPMDFFVYDVNARACNGYVCKTLCDICRMNPSPKPKRGL